MTIYRRWATKEELLAQAIEAARTLVPETAIWAATDTLGPQPDARLMDSWIGTLTSSNFRRVLAQLIGSSTTHPGLLEADVEALLDMVVGAAMYRMLIQPGPRDATEMRHYLERILGQTSRLLRQP